LGWVPVTLMFFWVSWLVSSVGSYPVIRLAVSCCFASFVQVMDVGEMFTLVTCPALS